jgi:hypothetical protein
VILAASKGAALLTYLAIATPRGFHRRDTLLALLWPELDSVSPYANYVYSSINDEGNSVFQIGLGVMWH